MAAKCRLDVLMVERGLAESRSAAQRLVMAGLVRVGGQAASKPATLVEAASTVTVVARPRYVSRGGEKLAAALAAFVISPSARVCADVGASTGGFTDCLLQHGASRVYAIDVGHGILHWRLRHDPRVILMERTNARNLTALPEQVSLLTVDVSFISLRLILPRAAAWLATQADVVALIKPQFEAGREAVRKGGVVRDAGVHRRVLEEVLAAAAGLGLGPRGLIRSPLRGPKGNVEFLVWCRPGRSAPRRRMIDQVLAEA